MRQAGPDLSLHSPGRFDLLASVPSSWEDRPGALTQTTHLFCFVVLFEIKYPIAKAGLELASQPSPAFRLSKCWEHGHISHICRFYLFACVRALCSLSWPQTYLVSEVELLVLLASASQVLELQACTNRYDLFSAEDQTQGFLLAVCELYLLSNICGSCLFLYRQQALSQRDR